MAANRDQLEQQYHELVLQKSKRAGKHLFESKRLGRSRPVYVYLHPQNPIRPILLDHIGIRAGWNMREWETGPSDESIHFHVSYAKNSMTSNRRPDEPK